MRFASHKDSILQNTVKVPVGVDGAFGVRDRGVENLTIARQAYAAALAQVELILEALAPFAANAQLSRFNVSCAIDDAFHIYLREMVRLVALLFFVFVCVPPPANFGPDLALFCPRSARSSHTHRQLPGRDAAG